MKITFNKGILGLQEYKEFDLVDLEGLEPYKMLKSVEDKEIGLVVGSPFEMDLGYEAKIPKETLEHLQISSQEDVLIFTTINVNSDVSKITTNLRAPIIINVKKSLGEQIILNNEIYKIKHPMYKG
ncbi:flagellar assembly protein FliW [Clostridium vincentii]|uniref:Flagellar assembly factor FliW n=1 Tax=Clostridium vincentii TaxID=52704 RepID=A0A2T0BG21_9CLOT|nr:flagellar assembly protein FliW [Clostridium vincentii]PRR82835.1 Flagellar assembly factor FliW [Clostridium vincentii]